MEMVVAGGIAHIDGDYLEMVMEQGNKWYIDKDGYCRLTKKDGKPIKLHRLIWEAMGNDGACSFVNGNRADCRSENLIPYVNGSKRELPIGVYPSEKKYAAIAWGRDKKGKRWQQPCGSWDTVEEAVKARENEIQKRH